jgi:hypothetical protein
VNVCIKSVFKGAKLVKEIQKASEHRMRDATRDAKYPIFTGSTKTENNPLPPENHSLCECSIPDVFFILFFKSKRLLLYKILKKQIKHPFNSDSNSRK